MPVWALILYLFVLALFSGLVALWFYRRLHRAVPEWSEWKRLTKDMTLGRRWAIRRCVHRGEAVHDPRDARAAVAAAKMTLSTFRYMEGWKWRVGEMGVVVYATLLLVLSVIGDGGLSLSALWHLALAAGPVLYLLIWRPRQRARLQRGLEANQRLMELSLAPDSQSLSSTPDQLTMLTR